MIWHEFVSKALDMGGRLVSVGYKDYEATLQKAPDITEAIKLLGVYGNFYFIRDGDVFFLPDKSVKKWVKLAHVSNYNDFEKMFNLVKAVI